MKKGHVPIRTCMGCLRKRPKHELLRLVFRSDSVGIGDCDGRGVYICPDRSCLDKALRSKKARRFIHRHLSEKELAEIESRIPEQNILDGGCRRGVICSSCSGGVAVG